MRRKFRGALGERNFKIAHSFSREKIRGGGKQGRKQKKPSRLKHPCSLCLINKLEIAGTASAAIRKLFFPSSIENKEPRFIRNFLNELCLMLVQNILIRIFFLLKIFIFTLFCSEFFLILSLLRVFIKKKKGGPLFPFI